MSHSIHRVEHFEIVAPYTLALRFADGSEQQIDFRPVLEGEVFGPLQDLNVFNRVELDTTFGTVQWPNGADFDPETLHDWPNIATNSSRWRVVGRPLPIQFTEPRANKARWTRRRVGPLSRPSRRWSSPIR